METEEFRPVAGFDGQYEVSSLGRVMSVRRVVNIGGNARWVGGHALKPFVDPDGYGLVKLSDPDGVKMKRVHRLICEAFHGPCPDGAECAHSDGDPGNNVPGNLSWKTKLENESDKVRHGTRPRGMVHWCAKLTEDAVREIRRLDATSTHMELSRIYGVSRAAIWSICARRTWRHIDG